MSAIVATHDDEEEEDKWRRNSLLVWSIYCLTEMWKMTVPLTWQKTTWGLTETTRKPAITTANNNNKCQSLQIYVQAIHDERDDDWKRNPYLVWNAYCLTEIRKVTWSHRNDTTTWLVTDDNSSSSNNNRKTAATKQVFNRLAIKCRLPPKMMMMIKDDDEIHTWFEVSSTSPSCENDCVIETWHKTTWHKTKTTREPAPTTANNNKC